MLAAEDKTLWAKILREMYKPFKQQWDFVRRTEKSRRRAKKTPVLKQSVAGWTRGKGPALKSFRVQVMHKNTSENKADWSVNGEEGVEMRRRGKEILSPRQQIWSPNNAQKTTKRLRERAMFAQSLEDAKVRSLGNVAMERVQVTSQDTSRSEDQWTSGSAVGRNVVDSNGAQPFNRRQHVIVAVFADRTYPRNNYECGNERFRYWEGQELQE